MADSDRTTSHPVTLLEQLEAEPYAFDFFQAVRRLDCAFPDKPQTGRSSRPADDPVRFGQEASMAFAPATLQAVERPEGRKPRLVQRFFGLLGPQGPLPLHLTEYVRDRLRNHGDFTLLRFFDVFHHRMTTFFYAAWARVRPTVSFDQPASDRFSDYVASLFGHGMRPFNRRDAMPDLPKRHFAGLLSCQTRHLDGLLALLRGFFRLPVRIEEFVGQWIELPATSRCMLGSSASSLGVDTTVGSHIWDCQQKFRVIFGPLTLHDYHRMLPGGGLSSSEVAVPEASGSAQKLALAPPSPQRSDSTDGALRPNASLERLIAVMQTYVGDELQWDLQLLLRHEETPPLGLGVIGRLGWSSWLVRDPMETDPDDLVLDAMQVPKSVENIEFSNPRNWNQGTLALTPDGRYIMATGDSDVPAAATIELVM